MPVDYPPQDIEPHANTQYVFVCKMRDGSSKSFLLSYLLSSHRGESLYKSFSRKLKKQKTNTRAIQIVLQDKVGEQQQEEDPETNSEEAENQEKEQEQEEQEEEGNILVDTEEEYLAEVEEQEEQEEQVTVQPEELDDFDLAEAGDDAIPYENLLMDNAVLTSNTNTLNKHNKNKNKKRRSKWAMKKKKNQPKKQSEKQQKYKAQQQQKQQKKQKQKKQKKQKKQQKKQKPQQQQQKPSHLETSQSSINYVQRYYTIKETEKMEIMLNQTISWAQTAQATQRCQNRGRYAKLIKRCPAAMELHKIIESNANRYLFFSYY
jgi:hypothetical protein